MFNNIRPLFEEGTLTTISGTMGTGKTDISWLIDGVGIIKHDLNVLNNKIIKNGYYFKYDRIVSDVQLYRYFLKYRKNILIGLDESNLFQNSKWNKQKTARQLEILISIIRHLRSAIYFIIQRDIDLLKPIRDLAYYDISKADKKGAIIKSKAGKEKIIENIPSAKRYNIDISTYSLADFSIRLDHSKIFKYIVKGKNYHQQIKRLEKISKNDFKGYWLSEGD